MVIANVGNSWVILGTASGDGTITVVQLIVHLKPNLPQEERIRWCNGQVYYLVDEPGVHFIWQPSQESSGLAMSHAFDDYCIKDCSFISAPEVTQRRTDNNDQFVILTAVGVWDVLSNDEAMQIMAYIEVCMILMVAM
ncbi:putative protein phosphatase 2C 33 [Zea mays]|uniref:protein-serine/threonine phosphatase n=1 Tax=Zea mays TaxID=4577 RepID=A0A1D6Q1K9_MAIZE|nr:putative protein phosphatase 2C 33 [Zea mays]